MSRLQNFPLSSPKWQNGATMKLKRREWLKTAAAAGASAAVACSPAGTQEDLQPSPADPLDHLTSMTEHVEPIPLAEFERRLEKARAWMRDGGYSAFVTESGATLEYFSGVRWGRSERMFGLVIPLQGAPSFICPAFEEERARERIRFSEPEVRIWAENESPYRRVLEALQDRGIRTGKVGIEPSTRLFILSGLRELRPAVELVDGGEISHGCRRTKSALEIEFMRLANQITKRTYQIVLGGLEEGLTEADLRRRISDVHARLGAVGGAMALFGPHSALPHGTQRVRSLQPGDVVLVDGGCSVNGYQSDVSRTVVYGEPSDKQKEVWRLVYEAQTLALETARPGVTCGDLDRIARSHIEEAGYGPGYEYFTHRLGHGIGLEGHEEPYLVETNDLPMEPGMSFSNEPGIYVPVEFGVRLEDIMVITSDGAEILGERSQWKGAEA